MGSPTSSARLKSRPMKLNRPPLDIPAPQREGAGFPARLDIGKDKSLHCSEMEFAMTALVEERSKITAKGQTTVPKAVRQALGVGYGDEIAFVVDERGVSVRRAEGEDTDPVIGRFLDFLARDMTEHPQNIRAFPPPLVERMASLTEGMMVDPEDEIEGQVSL